MSRQIDATDPEDLTDEERAYLAQRGRTLEQEAERQDRIEQHAKRMAEQAEQEGGEQIAYLRRTGQLL